MTVISKLLVANRGEIARRIVRTAHAMGIDTVAVHSDPDALAPFVAEAGEAVALCGARPSETYLRIDAILDAALRTGADAIHPGYGFLSESAPFARACVAAGLVFVGPSPEVIETMGSKLASKEVAAAAGVPLLPSATIGAGLPTDAAWRADVTAAGSALGAPVLVKASAGGGGRGMRVVHDLDELPDEVAAASREAASAFGDGTVYIERYIPRSRHVEVQIFGDSHGNVVHLHERECSIQRRHQKVLEEAPSASLDPTVRAALLDAAVTLGRTIGYENAGTVEFLVEPGGAFAFLEVNTRLQVEHPVTEAITGLDIVRWQLEVATGAVLPDQAQVPAPSGHAVEARLYAEDPSAGYAPTVGRISRLAFGDGLRVDSAFDAEGGDVSHHYDAMVAKVVAHAPSRAEALARLERGLRTSEVHGITTNVGLLARIVRHDEVRSGDADTSFLEKQDLGEMGAPLPDERARRAHALAAVLAGQAQRRQVAPVLRAAPSGFRSVPTTPQLVDLEVDGHELSVGYRLGPDGATATVDGEDLGRVGLIACSEVAVDLCLNGVRRRYRVSLGTDATWVSSELGTSRVVERPRFPIPGSAAVPGSLVAVMPGTVMAVTVSDGDLVNAGQVLLVLESMKMELSVTAPESGIVTSLGVSTGDAVSAGQLLAVVEPAGS